MTEKDIALGIAAQLEAQRWELFYEVEHPSGRRFRADIVAKKGDDLAVIAVKKTLSSAGLYAAELWRFYAQHVWTGIGGKVSTAMRSRLIETAAAAGIGVIHHQAGTLVDPDRQIASGADRLRKKLLDANRRLEPGSAGGERVTPLSETIDRMVAEVRILPGQPIEEVLAKITHHWDSDREALKKLAWLVCHGKVPQVTARKFGRAQKTLLLYPGRNV